MKRLSGWDAFLLYTETPNVHMHTLKIAVIDLEGLGDRKFGIDDFRKVLHGRLYKLDPFRYQLVDIPFKFHHPMWRENCDVDLDYHVRPWRVESPGGRRELDEAIGQIASTPLDRSHPLWEMYFVEGLANGRIAVVGKIHHALADGIASANLLARGMDLQQGPQRDRDSYATDPAPTKGELVRSAFRDHLRQIGRFPGGGALHRGGRGPGATEQPQAVPGADAAVHAAAEFHESPPHPGTPVRDGHAGSVRRQRDQQAARGDAQRPGAGHVFGGAAQTVAALRRGGRPPAAGVGADELRLLAGPHLRQPVQRCAGRPAGRR